jgi:hypothetical protein
MRRSSSLQNWRLSSVLGQKRSTLSKKECLLQVNTSKTLRFPETRMSAGFERFSVRCFGVMCEALWQIPAVSVSLLGAEL